MCYNKNMDDMLNSNSAVDLSSDTSSDNTELVDLNTVNSDENTSEGPVDAVVNEVEGRSQEELLAKELSAVKGISPEDIGAIKEDHISLNNPVDFGSQNEPELLVTIKTYEALGMPDPETLALGAIYEKMDQTMSEEEKKNRIDYIKNEYDNWKRDNS